MGVKAVKVIFESSFNQLFNLPEEGAPHPRSQHQTYSDTNIEVKSEKKIQDQVFIQEAYSKI